MHRQITIAIISAMFIAAPVLAYTDCRDIGKPDACTVADLIEISNQTHLTMPDRISALTQAVQKLLAQIAQIKSGNGASAVVIPSCFVPVNDLYMGRTDTQTNGEVSKLQQFLLDQGYGDPDGDSGFLLAKPTGYYGEKTATAVVKWQKTHGMDFVTLTSGVGKQTRAKMQQACSAAPVSRTELRSESEVPTMTYSYRIGADNTLEKKTEPLFGEGIVVDPATVGRIPENYQKFVASGNAHIIRFSFVNKTALSARMQHAEEANTVYMACSSPVAVGTKKQIGITIFLQCNPGAMWVVTADGRDIQIASDWAAG